MNKKGILIPTLALVFLAILLFILGARNAQGGKETIGETAAELRFFAEKANLQSFAINKKVNITVKKAMDNLIKDGKTRADYLDYFNDEFYKFPIQFQYSKHKFDIKLDGDFLVVNAVFNYDYSNMHYDLKKTYKEKVDFARLAKANAPVPLPLDNIFPQKK